MTDIPQEFSGDSLIGPASYLFGITPDDANNLPHPAKAIYIGTGGDVTVKALGSSLPVTLRNVASGSVLAIRLNAVRATGTTATDLVGLA